MIVPAIKVGVLSARCPMGNTKNAGMVSTVAAPNMLMESAVVNESRVGASGA